MICMDINPMGQFDNWDPELLDEIRLGEIGAELGQEKVFENEEIILWSVDLSPNHRLPFVNHNRSYAWICLSGGLALSRNANGRIDLVRFDAGDTGTVQKVSGSDRIRDLMNVDDSTLRFNILEFKEDAECRAPLVLKD